MNDCRKTIKWSDVTWNPVWGCLNKCPYCYARNIAKRFGKHICGRDDFVPVWIEKNFQKPIPKYATHVFVNSMSDVAFWEDEWLEKVLEKCKEYPDKKFLFLTKSQLAQKFRDFIPNCYLGKTITTNKTLKQTYKSYLDFLSIEPIQEEINLKMEYFGKLKQIIVGAETGNRKGKIIPKAEWIEEIREFCQKKGIKLFEKDSLKSIVKRDLIQERI